MPKFFDRIRTLINPAKGVRDNSPALSVRETDNTFYTGTQTAADIFRDRFDYDRRTILAEALRAWRTNPVARWVVQLTNVFVLGTGFEWECKHRRSQKFLKSFWDHPLNLLNSHIPAWLDEQTRSGDLFLLWSVDQSGMAYVRAVPSERITEIITAENDIQQELVFVTDERRETPGPRRPESMPRPARVGKAAIGRIGDMDRQCYPAFDPMDHKQITFMTHYAINQPVGCQFGESDLSPLLPWIGRLSTIVSDRVILNHVRSTISFVMEGKFNTPDAKTKRQHEIETHPPKQGSVLVTDESEQWSVLSAKLDASDAKNDILAVKKMIAVGVGVPLHYLAEPESSTRTTAEAAGTPTFRKFDDRQRQFKSVVESVLRTALTVRRRFDSKLPPAPDIVLIAGDITERDNSLLSLAAARIEPALGDLFDRHLIESDEYVRLFYRMIGEFLDDDKIPEEGLRRPLDKPSGNRPSTEPDDPEDLPEGEP
jgi:hypothetical protein